MFIAIYTYKYAFRENSIKNRVYYYALKICCNNNNHHNKKKTKQEARK